jgi:hypothetical protein
MTLGNRVAGTEDFGGGNWLAAAVVRTAIAIRAAAAWYLRFSAYITIIKAFLSALLLIVA